MSLIKSLFKTKRPTITITAEQLDGLRHYMVDFYGVKEMTFDLFKFRKIIKSFGPHKGEIHWIEEAKKRGPGWSCVR